MVLHRTLRKILTLFAALVCTAVMAGLAASPAQADPHRDLTQIDWNITNLDEGGDAAASAYHGMVGRLRDVSGHRLGNNLMETTTQPARVIEVRVLTAGHHLLSLYFWADNLYLGGYWEPHGGHYLFSDLWPDQMQRILGSPDDVHMLPWGSNYSELPGGSNRGSFNLGPQGIWTALNRLMRSHQLLPQDHRDVAAGILQTIAVTSEAARFGYIERLAGDSIRNNQPTQLGSTGLALENNWSRMSEWVRGELQNPTRPDLEVAGHRFSSIGALIAFVYYMEIKHPGS
ncbi:ribosome-inactivating family protein [Streptomyces luteolifulvus]|uniref:ribosome-inactivating family protein n=1 Tax=Streptomyces luteolifulvus TaxID=2615112 RepID=UPI00177C675D|nr:ribosome-inactivating family protein [Streptomyces luteolifulvus]